MEKKPINKKQNKMLNKNLNKSPLNIKKDDDNSKMSLLEKIDVSIITISIIIFGLSGFSGNGLAIIIPIGIIYGSLRENIKKLVENK